MAHEALVQLDAPARPWHGCTAAQPAGRRQFACAVLSPAHRLSPGSTLGLTSQHPGSGANICGSWAWTRLTVRTEQKGAAACVSRRAQVPAVRGPVIFWWSLGRLMPAGRAEGTLVGTSDGSRHSLGIYDPDASSAQGGRTGLHA